VQRLARRMPMFPMRQPSRVRLQSHQGVSVQDANRDGAKDARYTVLSVLDTKHSLQDTKLASGKEQAPFR
jgi:hypothetical protein